MITLRWVKCTNDQWCPLGTVNLSTVNTSGVYIIWHGGVAPQTVRVGKGDIAARLIAHRGDPSVQRYAPYGLYVTWAAVNAYDQDGVERFLADQLRPLVGERHPEVPAKLVNLPW